MQQKTNAVLEEQLQVCSTDLQAALAKVQQAETINQIAQVMNRMVVLDEVLQMTVDLLQDVLQVGRCLILQPDSGSELTVRRVSQACMQPGSLIDAYGKFYCRYTAALVQGQPIVIPRLEDSNLLVEIQADAEVCQVHSILIVPIRLQQSYWGGILLHQWEREREWTGDEIAFVQSVANLCAIAQALPCPKTTREAELTQQRTNILESITDAFVALNQDWCFTYVNPQAEPLLQKTRDELLGQNIWDAYPEAVGTAFYQEFHRAMEQKISVCFEEFYPPLNTWFESHVYSAKNGITIYFRDITERKQSEKALYQREQEFRALAENSPDIIFRIDKQLRHLYVNAAVEPATGLSSQAFIGKTNRELGIPEDLCRYWEENLQQVFITGQEHTVDFDFLATDGTTRNYQSRIVPEFALDGSVESILGVARDVTDFKQTEAALRESEQRFRQLAENIDAVFWIFSLDEQKTLYISPGYEKIWGRSSQALYANSENWMETIHPEDRAYVATMYERLNRGEFIEYLYRIVKLDGSVRWICDCAFPVYDAHGRLYRTAGIAQDITERKRAEEQLRASLQEKGVLLKEVHHRVKNNLQIICSLLDLQAEQIKDAIAQSTTPKAIALEAFRASQNRVKSIALIHEKLYQSENLARVNLADYIHTLATYLLQTYPINPNNITLQLNVEETFLNLDTVIPCGLIINELVSNALKHGFPGNSKGNIWIHLNSINSVDVESPEKKADRFNLIIGNNGLQLQDPENFYTAKSLGFQLVNILVKQLQGQIEVTQNQGTEFKIKFSDLDNSAK